MLLLGAVPNLGPGWRLEPLETIDQMTCETQISEIHGPKIVQLNDVNRRDVLALTALVYPHYFRPHSMELGRYFGIYAADKNGDDRLAAMIGERLGTDTCTEVSAVCTHPGFAGRGYASRLVCFLTNDILARGLAPFLHVSYKNPRAKLLYERLGYHLRRDLPFWSLQHS